MANCTCTIDDRQELGYIAIANKYECTCHVKFPFLLLYYAVQHTARCNTSYSD